MKRVLVTIVQAVFVICIAVFGLFYYLNYVFDGEVSFVSRDTVVYATDSKHSKQYTLKAGESFHSLSGSTDFYRIRYTNAKTDKEEIGFIPFESCETYFFPTEDQSLVIRPMVVIEVKKDTSFEDFLDFFTETLENYRILGVYLEVSDVAEDTRSIISFCENNSIPYGRLSDFTAHEIDKASERASFYSEDFGTTFELLPQAFAAESIPYNAGKIREIPNCILKSPLKLTSFDYNRYWQSSGGHDTNLGEEFLMVEFDENSDFTLSNVSTAFSDEIIELYSSFNDK